MVYMKDDLGEKLKEERRKRRYPFGEMNKDVPKNPLTLIDTKSDCVGIKLKLLKEQEPNSDNLFFRLAIIDYELGDVARAIVYSERFSSDESMFKVGDAKKVLFGGGFKDKSLILSDGKLAMADLLTQLYLLCLSMEKYGWKWEEIRELGAQHLEERHKDFKRDGWR